MPRRVKQVRANHTTALSMSPGMHWFMYPHRVSCRSANVSVYLQTNGLERRREDYGAITGRSHYVDDLKPSPERPPALHMVVVRSPYAHAEITSIRFDK